MKLFIGFLAGVGTVAVVEAILIYVTVRRIV